MSKPKTFIEELDTYIPVRRIDSIKRGATMFFFGVAACALLSFWRDPVGKTIAASKVSNQVGMVAGNENKVRRVIHDGRLKEWVGIGWVELREPTLSDCRRYPTVKQ